MVLKFYLDNNGNFTNPEQTVNVPLVQNSSNNSIYLYESIEDVVIVELSIRQPNGIIKPKLHLFSTTDSEGNAAWYLSKLPADYIGFTMSTARAYVDASFTLYKYDQDDSLRLFKTVNTKLTIERAASGGLDASYNGVDVDNLWKAVGNMVQKYLKQILIYKLISMTI